MTFAGFTESFSGHMVTAEGADMDPAVAPNPTFPGKGSALLDSLLPDTGVYKQAKFTNRVSWPWRPWASI